MTELVKAYKSGQIKGAISEAQIESIWSQIKSDTPSLISFINNLAKDHPYTQEEILEFKETLDVYTKLINLLCKTPLRREVPYFDQPIEKFCEEISAKVNPKDFELFIMGDPAKFTLMLKGNLAGTSKSLSLFDILCRILLKDNTDQSVFLYFLGFRGQEGVQDFIKKMWAIHLYLTKKK